MTIRAKQAHPIQGKFNPDGLTKAATLAGRQLGLTSAITHFELEQRLAADHNRPVNDLGRDSSRGLAGTDAHMLRADAKGELVGVTVNTRHFNCLGKKGQVIGTILRTCKKPLEKVHPWVAHKPAAKDIIRLIINFTRGGILDNPPILHQRDTVGQGHRLGLVVGDVDNRLVEAGEEFLKRPLELQLGIDIDIGDRLVEEDDARLTGNGAGNRDLLARAIVKTANILVYAIAHLQQFDHLMDAPLTFRLGELFFAQRQFDIFAHADAAVDHRILKDHANVALAR